MKVVISGGGGFIGSALTQSLLDGGNEVVVLSRRPETVLAGRGVAWAPPQSGAWQDELQSAGAVVNLAGASIADGRWTESRKRELRSSRIDATGSLVAAIDASGRRDLALVSASAIGFYGLRGDDILDEHSPAGGGFLSDLTQAWESAALEAQGTSRLVILRFGVVLDEGGGALAKMILPFRFGAGGPVGNGKQWMSWVTRADAVRAIEWAIFSGDASGTYNVTAPTPVRNREFASALGRALHRPAMLPAPAFALRLAFGEMADEVLLGGQRVVPARLQQSGFVFGQPTLETAFSAILTS